MLQTNAASKLADQQTKWSGWKSLPLNCLKNGAYEGEIARAIGVDHPTRNDAMLDARARMALARSVQSNDPKRAHAFAAHAFESVVRFTYLAKQEDLSQEAPWPLRDEPTLLYAFVEAAKLAERTVGLGMERELACITLNAARTTKRQQALQRQADACAKAPSAVEMLKTLQAGEDVDLDGNVLRWEDDIGTLTGTNAYGVDYFWGAMTLESVAGWRTRILAGETIGACPLGADVSVDEEDDMALANLHARIAYKWLDLQSDYEALAEMTNLWFTPDLYSLQDHTALRQSGDFGQFPWRAF